MCLCGTLSALRPQRAYPKSLSLHFSFGDRESVVRTDSLLSQNGRSPISSPKLSQIFWGVGINISILLYFPPLLNPPPSLEAQPEALFLVEVRWKREAMTPGGPRMVHS